MRAIILNLFVCAFVLCACTKDDSSANNLYQTWEAKEFMSIEPVAYPKTEGKKKVVMTFNPSGNVGLRLEVNGCESSFTISKSGQIKIDPFLCTLICCRSKFFDKL